MSAILQIEDYSYAYPETDDFVLTNVNLKIEPGQCHCLTGPTGSGKTTLALAMKGLLPQGRETGRIVCASRSDANSTGIGIILQNPETQLLASTIGAETAFGLENLCVDPALMPDMVKTALDAVGLDKPVEHGTTHLSMGEKYRLILAAQLVMNHNLLILDEPAGQLDPDGLEKLLRVIELLKKSGISFLLIENYPESFCDATDFFWHIAEGGVVRPGRAQARAHDSLRVRRPIHQRGAAAGEEIILARDLAMSSADGSPVWSDVSFSVARGGRIAVYGANGAGKTTLLRCLTGLVQPSGGVVEIFGGKPLPGNLRGKVGMLFQNPQKQLFESSVFDEIAFPLKRFARNGKALKSRVEEILVLCGIEHLADSSPHKLSYGQKHLVALASVLAPKPDLLLLDDPFAGLDPPACEAVIKVLSSSNENDGATILWTSHNPRVFPEWADSAFSLEQGGIVEQ